MIRGPPLFFGTFKFQIPSRSLCSGSFFQFFMLISNMQFKITSIGPIGRADTPGPSPPTCFGSKNSAILRRNSSKYSRGHLASRSQKYYKNDPQTGRGFESRRRQKNFTKKTFLPISKNVNYRSVACPWPKLWPFWLLQPSYNCTMAGQLNTIVWRHDAKKVSALDWVSML